jgi:hypothetical protein
MNDLKKLLPIARGNVWTGMPSLWWPRAESKSRLVRTNPRTRRVLHLTLIRLLRDVRSADHDVGGMQTYPERQASSKTGLRLVFGGGAPRSTGQNHFSIIPLAPFAGLRFASTIMKLPDPQRRRRDRLADLVQQHVWIRILFHLVGMAKKPRNARWHLRCISREFHEPSRKQ